MDSCSCGKKCKTCSCENGKEVVCPCCGELCKDDVTIEDHGRCIDCHKQILEGERCAGCWEYGHAIENCPDNEY